MAGLDSSFSATVERPERPSPIMRSGLWVLKTVAIWIVMIVASAIAAKLVGFTPGPPIRDPGPLSVENAAFLLTFIEALVVAMLAANARVSSLRLGGLIFAALFGIQTAMMQIETLYFNDSLHLPLIEIGMVTAQAAIVAAAVSLIAALLFRSSVPGKSRMPSNLAIRVAALAVIYVVLYFTAGGLIAWQSAAVRAFYNNGANIPMLPLAGLQIVRGTLWALISIYIVSRLKGSMGKRAAIMAVMFAVFTAAQLLYPNPYMPWAVRQYHLLEVGSSEFVYGIVATLVLLGGAARRPLSESSSWRLIAARDSI